MGKSVYSFGLESPITFEISDKLAQNYNDAVSEFFKTQRRLTQKLGRPWNPARDPVKVKWSNKQVKAWNEFAKVFKKAVEEQGPIHVNDLMDDYLVKHTAHEHAVALMGNKSRLITLAVAIGALYGYLRGLQSHV